MKSRVLLFLALTMTAFSQYANADTCPAPLETAVRLVLVVAPSMNAPSATMQLFKRTSTDAAWERASEVEPVVIGKGGLGWGSLFLEFKRDHEPEKIEGDMRTPAGVHRIGRGFG